MQAATRQLWYGRAMPKGEHGAGRQRLMCVRVTQVSPRSVIPIGMTMKAKLLLAFYPPFAYGPPRRIRGVPFTSARYGWVHEG